MKRLLIVASAAILAAGCQKTFVQDEVQTPIGFSTEVGKQTRAIVQQSGENSYLTSQPFAVYAYGHQNAGNGDVATTIMNNVEIFYDDQKDGKWRANGDITYYWPNDPRTTINFYAYSPSYSEEPSATENHQKLNGGISHSETDGLSITGYVHSNMYVDFMVADPVSGATYSDQNGTATGTPTTSVPLSFNHRMTQLVFKVKTDKTYSDEIIFTLKSITLHGIKNTANITNGVFTNDAYGNASYVIYPAKAESDANGAPGLNADQTATLEVDDVLSEVTEIIPVTMIPQAFDNNNQSFTVVYTVSGTGVATETVSKTFAFADTPQWDANKCITYTLSVGLKEITFDPSVAEWNPESGSFDI